MRHKTVFIFRDGAYKFSQECFFFTLRKRKLQLGELIGVASPSKDGLMSRDGFIKHESSSVSKDANTWFTGYVRADGFQNIPEPYGALLSFNTGGTVLQLFWTSEKIYWRNNWDGWHAWKML